jgi:hypothetical protein
MQHKATFLMHQALPLLAKHYPGLELAAVYDPEQCTYSEDSLLPAGLFPTHAHATAPVYERLSDGEERMLGFHGLGKEPVGTLTMRGSCSLGCARVHLHTLELRDKQGHVVWSWALSK